MTFSPEAISSKRTAVNSAVTIYIIGLVNAVFGWKISLDDISIIWIGAIIGFVMGVVYRLSRYATAKWPQLGWVLFGSGQEPAGMKPIK
jgi:hypothetical protein